MKLKPRPVKIAVIGTLCRDKIICPDGTVTESWGGIAYSVLTLSALLESKAEIIPICNVGQDCYPEIQNLFRQRPEVNLPGLYPVEQKNNAVRLTYRNHQEREEILEGGVPGLSFEKIEPFLTADYFLVNFISGWDIQLDALQKIRKTSQAKIHLDLHSLVLGKDQQGRRFFKKPEKWEEYVACADYLQLNRTELETLLEKKLSETEIKEAASKLLGLGSEIVVITLSDRGCHLTCRANENEITSKLVRSAPVAKVVDVTGCGDVFGAGFLAMLWAVGNPAQAAEFANHVAGLKATFSGLEGLRYFSPLDLEFA